MIDKPLIIIIFTYAISFSILGMQYVVADVFDVTLVNFNGDAIEAHIINFIDQDELNQRSVNMVQANFTTNSTYYSKIETFTTGAAFVAWELITLLSGTYIFNFMYLMGVPYYFVVGFVMLYLLLLGRAIVGYVRGI